jgi:hypothetical protein
LIKQASINLLRVSGVFDLMRLARGLHALTLTFHRFSSGGEESNGGAPGEEGKTPAKILAEQIGAPD